MRPTSVLATLSGRDRPGVTAALFAALAAHDVDVRDVEQVVIRERLVLAVLLDLTGDPRALRHSVTRAAHALGMECEFVVAGERREPSAPRASRCHVTVLGRPLRPGSLSHVAQCITDAEANIDSMSQLSSEPASSLDMVVRTSDPAGLRAVLVRAASETGLDIAVEPAGLTRRAKRLVVLDVDSTLVREDVVDLLVQRADAASGAAEIIARARAGELDFAAALRERVALLAGLTVQDLAEVADGLEITPGARTLVRTLRGVGYHVGAVSGGVTFVLDRLADDLGLEFVAANDLEIVDGTLTGRLTGDVLDRPGKAAALRRFAEHYGVALSQTVAVGSGANDIDMLEAAGLGVAFNARSAVRRAADTALDLTYLHTLLYVLGISDDDVAEATTGASGNATTDA